MIHRRLFFFRAPGNPGRRSPGSDPWSLTARLSMPCSGVVHKPVDAVVERGFWTPHTSITPVAGVSWPCSQLPAVTPGSAKLMTTPETWESSWGFWPATAFGQGLIFSGVTSGQTMKPTGWLDLKSRVQPDDNIVIALLDRSSRNFEEGVRIQAEPTGRNIAIVAVREKVGTSMTSPQRNSSGAQC